VFWGYFLWFECGLRCIIVVFVVLTVVSGENWLLGQIQGGRLQIGWGLGFHMNLRKCLKSSRIGCLLGLILILLGRI
jgi:hypothetical protein